MPITDLATKLFASSVGSTASAILGANGVKLGLPPWAAAGILGVAGAGVGIGARRDGTREVATGMVATAVSQAVMMAMGVSKPPTVIVAQANPGHAVPQRKNADLGVLPEGALDSAFERARSEIAVQHSGHGGHSEVYPVGFPEIPILPT